MEPKVSWQCSQKPATCPCSEPEQSYPHFPYLYCYLKIHFNIILPSKRNSLKWPISITFPIRTLHAPLLSLICASWPTYPIRLYLMIRIKLGREYRTWSSSWCSLLHSTVTFSLLRPNIFLSTLFSNTLSLAPSSMWQSFTPVQNETKF